MSLTRLETLIDEHLQLYAQVPNYWFRPKHHFVRHLPGDIDLEGNSFASFPNGLAAINGSDSISTAGLLQILALIAVLEIRVMTDVTGESEFRGDFRNGFDFGWAKQSEEWKLQKRAVELNQGRAAMMGILGLMVHEQLGGSVPIVGEL